MAYVKSDKIKGTIAEPPYERVLKIFASPDTPNMKTEYLVFGMSIIPPGSKTEKHAHEIAEECIYVISGSGEAEIDSKNIKLEPDIVVLIRPGEHHQLFNQCKKSMKLIWVYSPPGAEKKGFWKTLEK